MTSFVACRQPPIIPQLEGGGKKLPFSGITLSREGG